MVNPNSSSARSILFSVTDRLGLEVSAINSFISQAAAPAGYTVGGSFVGAHPEV